MTARPPHHRPATARHGGYSLVEVVAAIALLAATLVPAVELMREGMEVSEEADLRQLLALYAVSQVEEKLGATTYTWATGSTSGDYAAEGHAAIRYTTVCSDSALDGGVPGLLMDVSSTVYYDANGDDALTAGEMSCVYRTRIGKYSTYDATDP